MSERSLAAEITHFNIFFSIIPSAAARSHGNRHKYSRHNTAHQNAAQDFGRVIWKKENNQKRSGYRNHCRQSAASDNVYRLAIIRLSSSFHNSGNFSELPPHFFHYIASHFTHCFHSIRAEKIRKETTDKKPDQNRRILQSEFNRFPYFFNFLNIQSKKHGGGQTGGTDSVSLSHGFSGIAHRVQRISNFSHLFGQTGHFRNAARIIRDRSVRVMRNNNTGKRNHTHRGDSHAVKSGQLVRSENRTRDDNYGQSG